FSTTSPSWMMSCLTLIPVISSNALASVFDSYSWVVIFSDTTEISLMPLAWSFLAASMNHFISAVCCSFDSVDGWNSLSIHFLPSASPAQAPCPSDSAAAANATTCMRYLISVSSEYYFPCGGGRAAGKNGPESFSKNTSAQPLRRTNPSTSIETTKLIQIEGSASRPTTPTSFSLTATRPRLT